MRGQIRINIWKDELDEWAGSLSKWEILEIDERARRVNEWTNEKVSRSNKCE